MDLSHRINRLSVSLLFLTLGSATAVASAAEVKIRPGEAFPALVLPALDDARPLALADFRGRKVILQIFASW